MNKKSFLLVLLFFLLSIGNCFATIIGSRFKITESEEEFDVLYYITEDMDILEDGQNDDVNVTQAFSISRDGISGEVRYSLFTDTGEDESDLDIQYAMWVFMCLNNIAGFDVPGDVISSFNDSDVKREFNGDFGCTVFLQDPQSDYADGYKYMMVEFFYKERQGLVMRTFLFNDFDFLGIDQNGQLSSDSIWFANYHTFEFMEKDENGNFYHD